MLWQEHAQGRTISIGSLRRPPGWLVIQVMNGKNGSSSAKEAGTEKTSQAEAVGCTKTFKEKIFPLFKKKKTVYFIVK